MITLSAAAQSALDSGYTYHLRVESWLGATLLADAVPVADGQEDTMRPLRVPDRITLTVPKVDAQGYMWAPGNDPFHPLATNGQRLNVKLGIGVGNSVVEWFQRGWYVVEQTDGTGDSVKVEAVGLLHLVDEARLVSPYQPAGTLLSTLRGLVEPAMTVVMSSALTDRAVPAGINYDEDRLGAVLELLDAWPAQASVTPTGYLYVEPATPPTAALVTITNDPAARTIVSAGGESSRRGAWNAVVARGTDSSGGQVQGVSALPPSNPRVPGGPFNPLTVPFFYFSPLLTTVSQAALAAETIRLRKGRDGARAYRVEMVPRPNLQLGDPVNLVIDEEPDGLLCTVEEAGLPLRPSGGAHQVLLREVLA